MKERKLLEVNREKKWNSSQHEEKKEGNEKFEKKKDYSTMKCHKCNQVGHIQWQCPNLQLKEKNITET